VLDWQDASQDYTVDVQETMIRRDERPIVFAAYIQDIRATQEGYTLLLTPFAPHTLLNPPLLSWVVYTYYWLTCDRSLGETIRAHTRTAKQRDYFAVTARITALERPWFAVQDDTVQPTKGRTIIAHGHLLDMVPLEKQPARTPALSPHVPCSGLPLDEEMACEMTRARTPSRP
jgi:hypothetical protein